MSSSEPNKVSGRHRDTLRQIFVHPMSHNVEWRAVVALLNEVAPVREHEDKVEVTAADRTVVLKRPRTKDVAPDELVEVRHLLESLGYGSTEV